MTQINTNPKNIELTKKSLRSYSRREFLRTAARLGLSAGAFLVFEQACTNAIPPGINPTPTFPSPLPPTKSSFENPIPSKKLTVKPTQLPTPTFEKSKNIPIPTSTQSVTPISTSSPSPIKSTNAPSPSIITDPRIRMGHLLRRAGFGASHSEIDHYLTIGEEKVVKILLEFNKVDDSSLNNRLESLNLDPHNKLKELQSLSLLRMIYSERPLQEKMVLFWHGLLTSAFKKVGKGPHMLNQDKLFRLYALSPYDSLLKAVSKDPAMLIWLDSRVNKKRRPNENFARELMELFSMGVGKFTENDVTEAARAFTGWSIKKDAFYFEKNQHDFGIKTFLGRTGNFDGNDIVDIIMEQPVTSLFISKKLFEFFAYDNPSQDVIIKLAKTFNVNGYSIKHVMEQILTSNEFYSEKAYRAKIKSPAELVAGTIRTLEIETNATNFGYKFTQPMGQVLFNPFDVSGWPDGDGWINSSTLLHRLNFANAIATGYGKSFNYDPTRVLNENRTITTSEIVDYFSRLLLDGVMPSEERTIFITYLDALTNKPERGAKSRLASEKIRSLLYLIMSSPDYQLA